VDNSIVKGVRNLCESSAAKASLTKERELSQKSQKGRLVAPSLNKFNTRIISQSEVSEEPCYIDQSQATFQQSRLNSNKKYF